jgi:uncharacterized protein DUF1501
MMIRLNAEKSVHFCDGMTRRDFLHAGSLSLLGMSLPGFPSLDTQASEALPPSMGGPGGRDVSCIMIFLVGGPSQLDTWDMKPDAPAEIRGPYRPVETNVSGIRISEIFPRMAKHADKYALVRSVYHTAAALHDTGHQLMQTGRLFQDGIEHPHLGCVLAKLKGSRGMTPRHVVLPTPMGATGGDLPHGQDAGYLGRYYNPMVLNADPSVMDFEPREAVLPNRIAGVRVGRRPSVRNAVDASYRSSEHSGDPRLQEETFSRAYTLISSQEAREAFDVWGEPEALRRKYGMNKFGQSCLLARRMIEHGVRFVTINMFETVFNEITWDIHGSQPFTPIQAYGEVVGPWFDNGYATLLEDLHARGMLESTLVLAMGEFGRTPRLNPAGGRDHWPQCWTILFAGGGVRGGQVVGASDEIGAYPKDRPVTPAEVAATVYHSLGVDPCTELPGPHGRPIPVVDPGVKPIKELF